MFEECWWQTEPAYTISSPRWANQRTTGPVSLTWVHRICWIRTSLEIHDYMPYKLSPMQKIWTQIWPCHKNGHGQPSVIIWTNLNFAVLEYPMLYIQVSVPKKEIFEGFYLEHLNKFSSQHPMEAVNLLNLSDLGQRSMNDLDLGLSSIIMYSFILLYVPTFSSQASIVSW